MRKILVMFIICLIFYHEAFACEKLIPNELENVRIQPIYRQEKINIFIEDKERALKVNHEIKGKDVYIECLIDSFTFVKAQARKHHVDGEGYLLLYIDDEKVDKLYERAFIVKGLREGKHTLKIELVRNDDLPYGLEEEITVEI